MTYTQFAFASSDGLDLAGYRWDATDSPRGAVALVHGMGEHVLRYDELASALNAEGYVVYGYDHRGHGASTIPGREPGDLGPGGWPALVEDIGLFIDVVRAEQPALPIVLIAHSMGSFATQQFLIDNSTRVDAVALTGTASLDLLELALDLEKDLDLAMFNAPFAPARTDFDWLSRDEAEVDAYVADPLCGFGIDLDSAKAMFVGARRVADPATLARVRSGLPLYVAVGSKDPVNANLLLVDPFIDRLRAAGVQDLTYRVYEDARHELFNEINRAEVRADLVGWIRRLSGDTAVASG